MYFQKDCAILTVTHWRTAPLLRGRVSTAEEKENCFLESREMRWIFQRLYKWNLLRSLNPGRIVVASFAIIILVGALLLMLPISSRDGQVTDFISCLFTATSATCVTGLIVVDTYMHWTLFGQVVIICLIQLGGLGFMTLISVISFLLRRRIGLSERLLMASTLNLNDMDGVVRVVRHALMGTFLLEGIGAAILALRFIPDFGLLKGIWRGIFHSISAFCNAGFDILGVDQPFVSLTNYNDDPVILLVIMSLIVIGGLGFFLELAAKGWCGARESGDPARLRSAESNLLASILVLAAAVLRYRDLNSTEVEERCRAASGRNHTEGGAP